jgi:hypothetical protein
VLYYFDDVFIYFGTYYFWLFALFYPSQDLKNWLKDAGTVTTSNLARQLGATSASHDAVVVALDLIKVIWVGAKIIGKYANFKQFRMMLVYLHDADLALVEDRDDSESSSSSDSDGETLIQDGETLIQAPVAPALIQQTASPIQTAAAASPIQTAAATSIPALPESDPASTTAPVPPRATSPLSHNVENASDGVDQGDVFHQIMLESGARHRSVSDSDSTTAGQL